MHRRDFLRAAMVAGRSPFWADLLMSCATLPTGLRAAPGWTPRVLTSQNLETLETAGDLIIPENDTPGSKSSNLGEFVDRLLELTESNRRRETVSHLTWFDQRSHELSGLTFSKSRYPDQIRLLEHMSALATRYALGRKLIGPRGSRRSMGNGAIEPVFRFVAGTPMKDRTDVLAFQEVKSLTILAYFTSEAGCRVALGETREALKIAFGDAAVPNLSTEN